MSSARTSEQATNGQPPSYSHSRRSSLGPGTLTDFFSTSRVPPTSAYPGPITSAAAQANRRRMSMSNASGTSPPRVQTNMSMRRGSISSVSSASSAVDESAIEEGEATAGSPPSLGSSPFARRLSFGARALRDVRIPQGRTPANFPASAGAASPTVTRGFWLDGRSGSQSQGSDRDEAPPVQRRQSISAMPPPVNAISPKDAHDPLQERMLKGDFYMD